MKDEQNREKRQGITPNEIFLLAVKLVTLGIVLYVTLNNLDKVLAFVGKVFALASPLLIGALIALILNTPMMAVEKQFSRISEKRGKAIPMKTAAVVSLVITFAAAALVIYLLAHTIFPQLGESVRGIYEKVMAALPGWIDKLNELKKYGINAEPVENFLREIDLESIMTKVSENSAAILSTLTSGATSLISGATSVISWIVTAFTSVIFSIYILVNKQKLGAQIRNVGYAFLKKSAADRIGRVFRLCVNTFAGFISGQCFEAIILGLLFFIVLSLLGFPYALAISSIICVTAIIPYVGAFLGCAFGMLLMVIDDPLQALWFMIVFLIIQQVENQLIYPRVVGGSIGLPAIWTFAAVIIGGGLCGVLGMILFIPLFSVLYTLLKEEVHLRLTAKGIEVADSGESDSATPEEKKSGGVFEKIFTIIKSKLEKKKSAGASSGGEGDEGNGDVS